MSSTPPPAAYVPEPYQPRTAAARVADPTVIGLETYVAQVVLPARRHKRRVRLTLLALVLLVTAAIASWQLDFGASATRPAAVPVGSGVTSGASTNSPGDLGTVYRSAAGHYAARFLGLPLETTKPGAADGQLFTFHLTGDDNADAFVAGAELYPGIPPQQSEALLLGLVAGMAGPTGLAVAENKAITFHGRPARQARLVDAKGNSINVLAAVYGTQRIYVLSAPSGSAFNLLKDSFVALP